MLNVKLTGLGTNTNFEVVTNIENGAIERMTSFNVMELSQEDQAQILAVLNRHLDSLALSTKLSKIAQVL
jgi:hypothetical protein